MSRYLGKLSHLHFLGMLYGFLFSNINWTILVFFSLNHWQPAEDLPDNLSREFDIIVDAMFGFSFHGKFAF